MSRAKPVVSGDENDVTVPPKSGECTRGGERRTSPLRPGPPSLDELDGAPRGSDTTDWGGHRAGSGTLESDDVVEFIDYPTHYDATPSSTGGRGGGCGALSTRGGGLYTLEERVDSGVLEVDTPWTTLGARSSQVCGQEDFNKRQILRKSDGNKGHCDVIVTSSLSADLTVRDSSVYTSTKLVLHTQTVTSPIRQVTSPTKQVTSPTKQVTSLTKQVMEVRRVTRSPVELISRGCKEESTTQSFIRDIPLTSSIDRRRSVTSCKKSSVEVEVRPIEPMSCRPTDMDVVVVPSTAASWSSSNSCDELARDLWECVCIDRGDVAHPSTFTSNTAVLQRDLTHHSTSTSNTADIQRYVAHPSTSPSNTAAVLYQEVEMEESNEDCNILSQQNEDGDT